jgi:AcrR family transcriptional regulator
MTYPSFGSRRPTTGARRRRTAGGGQLSADRIVDAAENLLKYRGPEGLSARKLGTALGADPTAIYRYFSGMDDLVLAVADRTIGRALAGFTVGDDWRAALRDIACRVHTAYVAHPNLALVAASRVTRRPNEMLFVETVLGILAQAGFNTAESVARYRALADTILSFAAQDAGVEILPPEVRRADDQSWQIAYGELSPETHPHIHRAQQLLAEQMTESSFLTALDFLLAGFGNPAS